MVEKKTGAIDRIAIDHIVKLRDRLVVERLRLFRLKRAIDAYAQTVDRELLECVEAGRELGEKIALPIWENVWKTSLLEEMRRVCAVSEWTRHVPRWGGARRLRTSRLSRAPGKPARPKAYPSPTCVGSTAIGWSRRLESRPDPSPRQTNSGTRLPWQGMTLNRLAKQGLAKQGLARRKGHVWFPVGRSFELGEGREEEPIRV